MRIAFGCDHGGFTLKEKLVNHLQSRGFKIIDLGTTDAHTSVDYPDYAGNVAKLVIKNKVDMGILCCGTGIGMCITANKVKGIRAASVWNAKTAALAREHNNANIICLGGRVLTTQNAISIVNAFLKAKPSSSPRHAHRLRKISKLERKC
ncbi:ribose 5-phosphate isomerase B [Elusimicrobiota bacterium]